MTKKLERLERRMEQIKARLQLEKNRIQSKEKKAETRRKILIGAFFMEKYKNRMDQLIREMDPFLIRDNDRDLFNLPVNNIPHSDDSVPANNKKTDR